MSKVFILDFDGTFYSGEKVFSLVEEHVNNHRRSFFPHISDEEYQRILKENPHFASEINGGKIVEDMYEFRKKYPEMKISPKGFFDFQCKYPDPIVLDGADIIRAEFVKTLCENYAVYVVSNSSLNHLKKYMKQMNIDYKWFKKLIANRFTLKDRSKKHYYKTIMERENISPKQVYVFGDSEKSDLLPGRELNMNVYKIEKASEVEKLINELIK